MLITENKTKRRSLDGVAVESAKLARVRDLDDTLTYLISVS